MTRARNGAAAPSLPIDSYAHYCTPPGWRQEGRPQPPPVPLPKPEPLRAPTVAERLVFGFVPGDGPLWPWDEDPPAEGPDPKRLGARAYLQDRKHEPGLLGPHSAYLKDVRNKSPLRAGDASKSHHAVTYVDEAAPEWFDTDDDAAKFLRANWPESDKRFPLVGEAAQEWDPLHIPDLVNAMLPGPDVTGYDAMALFTALLGRGTDKRAAPETSERALAAERGVSRHEIRTFAGSLAEMIETALALFAPALEAEPTIPPL